MARARHLDLDLAEQKRVLWTFDLDLDCDKNDYKVFTGDFLCFEFNILMKYDFSDCNYD